MYGTRVFANHPKVVCKSFKGYVRLKGEEWGGAGIVRDETRGRMRRNGIKSIRADIWGEIWQNVVKIRR